MVNRGSHVFAMVTRLTVTRHPRLGCLGFPAPTLGAWKKGMVRTLESGAPDHVHGSKLSNG